MKKHFTLLVISALTISVFSQVPQKLSYQFVVRNAGGTLIANSPVGVRIAILQGSATGTVVYQELFNPNPQTNANGLVSIEIGTGLPITGTFSAINWAGSPYYLKTETDPAGGTSYTVVGTSQLISVPYALHSKTTESIPDNSVTSAKILDGTIVTADVANGTVTSAKIGDGNVTTADLADNSVTSAKIADGNITTADIADNAVTIAKISSSGASTNQVVQYSGSDVVWGYAPGSEIKLTVLNTGCYSAASFGSTAYVKIADIGSFVKMVATSKMEITFEGRVWAQTMSGTGARFELRVDNAASTIGDAKVSIKAAQAGGIGEHVSITGIYTGLSTGTHTISIWVIGAGGSGTNGGVDPGCFSDDHIIAREVQ
jgi:hypothetical protein